MTGFVYTSALHRLTLGELVWDEIDARVLLLDSAGGYVPDRGHSVVAHLDPASTELTASNYGRRPIDGLALFAMGDRVQFSASAVSWTDLGQGDPTTHVQAAVIYQHDPDDQAALLVAYVDMGDAELTGTTAVLAWQNGAALEAVAP